MHTSAVRATLRHPAGPKLSILFCFHSHSYPLSKARVRNVGKSGGSLSCGGTLALKAGLSSHNHSHNHHARPPNTIAPRPPHKELRGANGGVGPAKQSEASTYTQCICYHYLFYARRRHAHLICMPISRTSFCASFAAPRTQQDQPNLTGQKRAGAPCYISR